MTSTLNISEAASIAMHALILLAEGKGAPVSNSRIASAFGVSANHSSKVMQRLLKAGFVTALRGPTGGYSLVREPKDVTLLDVYRAMDGQPTATECLFGGGVHCSLKTCLFKDLLADADALIEKHLGSVTLENFMDSSIELRGTL